MKRGLNFKLKKLSTLSDLIQSIQFFKIKFIIFTLGIFSLVQGSWPLVIGHWPSLLQVKPPCMSYLPKYSATIPNPSSAFSSWAWNWSCWCLPASWLFTYSVCLQKIENFYLIFIFFNIFIFFLNQNYLQIFFF